MWAERPRLQGVAETGLGAASHIVDWGSVLDEDGASEEGVAEHIVAFPTGRPTAIGCGQARAVVAQVRDELAAPAGPVSPAAFAEAVSDWLDPHGLWSVAPDSPIAADLRREATGLLGDLHAAPATDRCVASDRVAAALVDYSATLRRDFDASYHAALAKETTTEDAFTLMSEAPFQDGPVTTRASELVAELGRTAASLRRAYGAALDPYIGSLRERIAPALDVDGWSRVVIAAALRAYVPQVDAHGAWAPVDEDLSIYDLALERDPPQRLWAEMTRTSLGVRVDRGAFPPLEDGDVVLRVHDVDLAGVSVEQAEQLAAVEGGAFDGPTHATVLRAGAAAPIELTVEASRRHEPAIADEEVTGLATRRVPYERGHALVITIPDVPDDLAAQVSAAIDLARESGDLRGILLDLRANGGGSTDGAIATLGLFLPGAALFPMRRRDGAMEVDRAPEPPEAKRWAGPVAALVDGNTASAAEMISGALASYHRGVVLGDRTFGKGCAQEYLDDAGRVGVLRLTTLLYALPDGSPVQKVGVAPSVHLSLPASSEREASTKRALGPWRGPDVRDGKLIGEVLWPAHAGHVGPCVDANVCRALRALGAARAASR